MNLRRHDFRAARTFIRKMYPDQPALLRSLRFLRWVSHQCFTAIPEGLRGTRFEQPVSPTPVWLAKGNPLAGHPWNQNPHAPLPAKAEVVVIGAGFTGASLAYHWARSGTEKSMVVLEMNDPASGASGRNAGEVVMGRYFALVYSTVHKHLPRARPDLSSEDIAQLARQFAAMYCKAAYKNADLVERTIREEGFDCDYARQGWVQERSGSEQEILEESVRMGKENGFADWDKISAEEASAKTGASIGLPANISRNAGRFHPAKWVWSLFERALQSSSVQLFTQTKVLAVEGDSESYLVTTSRGPVHARHVVFATEAYTPNLQTHFHSIINPRQTQAAYGIDHGRSLKPDISFSSSTFFCVRHENGILFGSDETPIPDSEVGKNLASRFITAYTAGQLRKSFGRFPLQVTNEWAGSVGFTPDEYPIVGTIDGKRQYIIAGMSGSGTAVSFNAGRCICRRILGQTDDDDYPAEYFAPSRLLDPAKHVWPAIVRESPTGTH
jgi:glycine/D-amino acid oxidase-like deaminating enzyme